MFKKLGLIFVGVFSLLCLMFAFVPANADTQGEDGSTFTLDNKDGIIGQFRWSAHWTGNKGAEVPNPDNHESFIVANKDRGVTFVVKSFTNCNYRSATPHYPELEIELFSEHEFPDESLGTKVYTCNTMDSHSFVWNNLQHNNEYHVTLFLREPHRNDDPTHRMDFDMLWACEQGNCLDDFGPVD